ncbi:MAG: hypothetical protein JW958_04740 [Candidatus Eisenbacteria bacterium]|nr:hypothetical protein [Candidatus Eisenbacteria bacterium]
MNRSKIVWCAALAATVLAAVLPEEAGAIPAFARRHKLSCSTCHVPFPKLKPYGDEFAGNGFMIPEEEKERDYITAGDDLLWLNKDFPVAIRFDAYGVYEDALEDGDVEYDLQSPWGIKLMSGGALYRNIGYYFYFYMSERGEVAGIEDAYVHFNDVFGVPLDVLVGQFQTSDPLMKRELRLTFEDYQIYKTRIGDSMNNLAYDRGVMLLYGIERTGTDLVGMVVNGNGKPEADENLKFDNDKFKNYGFRLAQGIGEYASVGGFIYYGKERTVGGEENEITYWGPDANGGYGPVGATVQYLLRKDTNPTFIDSPEDVETEGIVVEVVVSPQEDRSRFFFTGLYNRIDSDLDDYDYETATAGVTYLFARNLRFLAEYTRDLERETDRGVIGMVTGF